MRFHKAELENGLTVIGECNPAARSMAAGYFVQTGARDETPAESGISHFLEHMLFKGTARRSGEDVNREFDEIGADYNAFTGEEYTVYYGAVLPEHRERLLDLLTDMMRPTLHPDDFQTEKQVILEEIEMYKDRPQFTVIDVARAAYYSDHPLGQSVLGTTESITAATPEQMRDYWRRRYLPGNLTLALTGNFDWEAALEQVRGLTRGWEAGSSPRERPPFAPAPRVQVVRSDRFQRVHLAFVAPGIAAQDPRRFAASTLGIALGGGEGSRLHWELVEPGLADSVRLSHDQEDGSGAFFGYASCDPERVPEVVTRIRRVLTGVMDEGLKEDELERARRKVSSALVLQDETPSGRLFDVGFEWMYRRVYEPLDEALEAYRRVTVEETRALLDPRPFDTLTLVGLGPLEALA